MPLSLPYILLTTKQLEIAELKQLQSRARLIGILSHLVHSLQAERGASSLYLASTGKRFKDTRRELIIDSETVERLLRDTLEEELGGSALSNPKVTSLIAWIVVGLDALTELRNEIDALHLEGRQSVAAFSRVIAGLISLIFELADTAVDPEISRCLVSLFNLVEGKEHAGQERAVGALLFGSGIREEKLHQRLLHLIDAQARNFRIFTQFSNEQTKSRWNAMDGESFMQRFLALRRILEQSEPEKTLDAGLSDDWFDYSSQRITYMWGIQKDLVEELQQKCSALIQKAEQSLTDSEGLLQSVRKNSPARVDAVERFFDPDLPVESALNFHQGSIDSGDSGRSLLDLLQTQSRHLADMETELASAKQAMNERKLIERAKGIVMAKYGLSEENAYREMRKISMDRNIRLAQVAEIVLAS